MKFCSSVTALFFKLLFIKRNADVLIISASTGWIYATSQAKIRFVAYY